jgi:hypothetical protein
VSEVARESNRSTQCKETNNSFSIFCLTDLFLCGSIQTQIIQMPKGVAKGKKENAVPAMDPLLSSSVRSRPAVDSSAIQGKAAEYREKRSALASIAPTGGEGPKPTLALAEPTKSAGGSGRLVSAVPPPPAPPRGGGWAADRIKKKFQNARDSTGGRDSLSSECSHEWDADQVRLGNRLPSRTRLWFCHGPDTM